MQNQTIAYTKSAYYRPDIDGLRAIAVIFVIISHYFAGIFDGGYIGVDIFFVISGFLISSILYREMQRNRFSFLKFYRKRIRRIFPAMLVVLLTGLGLGAFLLTPREYAEMGAHAFYGSVFFENLRLARGIDYFGLEIARNPFMHLWSLSVEEQFYIFFPLLLGAVWRYTRRLVFPLLCVLSLGSFVAGLFYIGVEPRRAYFMPHSRFWELAAGAILAYGYYARYRIAHVQKLFVWCRKNGHTLSVISLVALVACAYTYGEVARRFPGYWGLIPILSTLMLIIAGTQAWVNHKILSQKAVIYIGWLSYPMYLWHWLFYSISYSLYSGHIPLAVKGICLLATLVASWLTFRLIEKPIRNQKVSHRLCLMLVAIWLAVASLAGLIRRQDGWDWRLDSTQLQLVEMTKRYEETDPKHYCGDMDPENCWTSAGLEKVQIVMTGNSHAQHFKGVIGQTAPNHIAVDVYAAGGTVPFFGHVERFSERSLARSYRKETALAMTEKSPAKIVVFSSMGPYLGDGATYLMNTLDGKKVLASQLFDETMQRMHASGKEVIYLIDTPKMPIEIETCLGTRPLPVGKVSCRIPRARYDQQNAKTLEFLQAYARKNPWFHVLETGKVFCDMNTCSMVNAKGEPRYNDSHHLSAIGAKEVMQRFWIQAKPILQKVGL